MGSYITGVVIAMGLVFGLYASVELTTGNSFFTQDQLVNHSEDQLRVLAVEFGSLDQVEAILQLGERPGDLAKTVPILARLTTAPNEMIKNAADSSLETIGASGAEYIRDFMEENTTSGYRISCSAIRAIGPGAEIYLPHLKRLLEDENPLHRKCGLYALQGMGEAGKGAMQEIIVCVLDNDLNNQCSACRILETFGTDAIDAEESLLQLQKEGGPSTRGWAAVCLGAIGPTSSDVDVAEILAQQLEPREDGRPVTPVEQERVLMGLAYLGPEATKVLDAVRKKLDVRDPYVRGHAAYALYRITGESEESFRTLRDILGDPNYEVDGLRIVGRMGTDGFPLAPDVARSLSSSEPGSREAAVVAIGNMGPCAIAYKDSISERLKDTDPMVRMSARKALANITPKEELESTKAKNADEPSEIQADKKADK